MESGKVENVKCRGDAVAELLALTDGKGYDDVLCMAPVRPVVEQGDKILGRDGCLNFFAGCGVFSRKLLTLTFQFCFLYCGTISRFFGSMLCSSAASFSLKSLDSFWLLRVNSASRLV